MGDVKYIDAEEFRERGYLQEANRRFFHPLGLALEMTWGGPDEGFAVLSLSHLMSLANCAAHTRDRSGEEDDAMDAAWKAIEGGGRRAILSGVWDYRDDPEGMNFTFMDFEGSDTVPPMTAEEQRDEFLRKFEQVKQEWHLRRRPRVVGLGYMVQPVGDHFTEVGSDIVNLLGSALGEEMSKVIPVKATSESWNKAARGILDKLSERIANEPYNPEEVTAEEVHIIDLVLMGEQVPEARTRLEAVNMVVDRARHYKEKATQYEVLLRRLVDGDIPPGTSWRDMAYAALTGQADDEIKEEGNDNV